MTFTKEAAAGSNVVALMLQPWWLWCYHHGDGFSGDLVSLTRWWRTVTHRNGIHLQEHDGHICKQCLHHRDHHHKWYFSPILKGQLSRLECLHCFDMCRVHCTLSEPELTHFLLITCINSCWQHGPCQHGPCQHGPVPDDRIANMVPAADDISVDSWLELKLREPAGCLARTLTQSFDTGRPILTFLEQSSCFYLNI